MLAARIPTRVTQVEHASATILAKRHVETVAFAMKENAFVLTRCRTVLFTAMRGHAPLGTTENSARKMNARYAVMMGTASTILRQSVEQVTAELAMLTPPASVSQAVVGVECVALAATAGRPGPEQTCVPTQMAGVLIPGRGVEKRVRNAFKAFVSVTSTGVEKDAATDYVSNV